MPAPEDGTHRGMSDEELAAHLGEMETRAVGYYESEIASEQADALDRYYRRPYGDERDGRSQVVDATVAITVDNALAATLKPFVSSDETVVFEPKGPEDEEQAEQATDYVNYVLHNDNCGFQILHDWFKDAFLQKVGVVKAYWEDYTRECIERVENCDPMQVQSLQQDGSLVHAYGPDELGLFTCDIRQVHADGKLCVENIPPEEYRISPLARPGRIPPYEAHITNKPRSELIEMGFDHEVVMNLSKANSTMADSRAQARYQDEDFLSSTTEVPGDESRQLVQVNDEYVLIDYDGDGVSELRHVIRCNTTILLNEEVDYTPFARLCPIPMPHKVYGLSLADVTKDEQRISTALWRQTLDNLYLSNNPRPTLGQAAERDDGTTVDDLLSDAPGAIIRTKDNTQLGNFAVPFVADKSFPMLEYVNQQADARSGISQQGQAMDPDALSTAGQVTATQAAIMEDGRNSRVEMIARIFAETGVKDLFRLILKLVVMHQPRSRIIRLRNKWVEMDPRSWNADMDVSISVGLGMGSKAEQITTAQSVLATMETIGASPYSNLIDAEKVYNALKKLYTAAGIKNIDDFLNEPPKDDQGNLIPQPTPPDPATMKAQSDIQIAQQKAATDAQVAEHGAWLKQMIAQNQAALDAAKANTEAQLGAMRLHMQAQLDAIQAGHDMKLAEVQAAHDHELGRMKAENDAKLQKFRSGGKLDE